VSFCFEKDKRLLKPSQFKAVFDKADNKVSDKTILILVRYNQLSHARLGLVIGKKNVKLAVERNRLKRQIRESFRHHQAKLAGLDLVVIARKGAADLENIELNKQFDKLWQRLLRRTQTSIEQSP